MTARRWCMMALFGFLNFLSGCGSSDMNKDTKQITNFRWYAVATAPRDYPMTVSRGTFYCKGLDMGMAIPSGGTLTTGWGKSASGYSTFEVKPLPDRVEVEFFSYAERQSYRAEFALPYDKILAIFQQQLKDGLPKDENNEFLLGIAPGGAVSVWVAGPKVLEVYFGQAQKIEKTPSETFDLPFKSAEQSTDYVEQALAGRVTPEQLAYIKTHGAPIGTWARYRNLYKWAPVYKEGKPVIGTDMSVDYLNGESYRTPTHFSDELTNTPKPLPSGLIFRAQVTQDERPVYVIDFEPVELMEAFEKLGAQGEKVYIEFDARIPVTDMKIRIYNDTKPKDAKTPKEYIELKKFKVDP